MYIYAFTYLLFKSIIYLSTLYFLNCIIEGTNWHVMNCVLNWQIMRTCFWNPNLHTMRTYLCILNWHEDVSLCFELTHYKDVPLW